MRVKKDDVISFLIIEKKKSEVKGTELWVVLS